jgi:transcriptional regulator
MAMDVTSQSESLQSLLKNGDELERETWHELRNYIGLYETIWHLFSMPLRLENSIYFRDGIDPDLEMLAMCNYTAYVNVARALKKIKTMEDDLMFSEEIWANLQRAVEVGKKVAGAFEKVYASSTGKNLKLDRRQLESAEVQIKEYRNRLHETVPATIKDAAKTRLLPKRELLSQYELWTKVMYHARRDDFVTVEGQLQSGNSSQYSSLRS